jgi:hypothetical protein
LQQVANQRRKFGNDVVRCFDKFGSLADELMTAARERIMDRSWQRKDLAALLRGKPCRDQRAAALRRLDDERAEADAADQPVALRKQLLARVHAERELADQRATCRDLLTQRLVARRVDSIDTMAEKRDRVTTGGQRAAVRRRINTLGEAADDGKAEARQVLCELESIALSASRWVAAANDGECGQLQQVRVTSYI